MDRNIDQAELTMIKKYKKDLLSLMENEDNFLNALYQEYDSININELMRTQMITNPQVFKTSFTKEDLIKVKDILIRETVQKLYTHNYINEGEYKKLCQTQK